MTFDRVRRSRSPGLAAAGLLCVVLALAACGRRGPLEPPPDAPKDEIRVPTTKPLPPPEGQRPDKPFILDGLL